MKVKGVLITLVLAIATGSATAADQKRVAEQVNFDRFQQLQARLSYRIEEMLAERLELLECHVGLVMPARAYKKGPACAHAGPDGLLAAEPPQSSN